jgi:serine/threonine-protein kinase
MALAETVDARADIYALGCVTYFLLTGRLVFEADGPLQMVAKHFSAQPVPPSRNGGIDVPPALDEMILKCLAKKPDDRPQSAAIVSQLLAEVRTEVWSEKDAAEWWAARAAQEFTSRSPRPDSPAVQPAPAVPSPA